MLYKNPLFKNLSPYPGGIHQTQVASTLRTLGYPSFWSQVLNFLGLFPHQGNLESKTKFPNPPHQQTLYCSCYLLLLLLPIASAATPLRPLKSFQGPKIFKRTLNPIKQNPEPLKGKKLRLPFQAMTNYMPKSCSLKLGFRVYG